LVLKLALYMWQKIKNIYHYFQALSAALYFRFPSKKLIVIGITGTDGKTTTVNMLHHVLSLNNKKVSSISSISAKIADKSFDTGFHVTTPSPWQIQKYLRNALNSRSQYFILEATSHGLDQNRLAFIDFEVAAITNISHEHFDYHKSMKNYLASKAKLFKNVKYSVLNADDESYKDLKNKASGEILNYSLQKNVDFNLKEYPINLKIPGEFNLKNALAALAISSALGISKSRTLKAITSYKGIVGRLEDLDFGQNFDVYVDFAHTPVSLKESLQTLKEKTRGRLIAVFGSAGKRDESKRPLMGKVASSLADISILTAEDPRDEDVNKICNQIAKGFKSNRKKENEDFFIIPDRKKAIKFAVDLARSNDTVSLFGKGHEKSMNIKGKEFPWNEINVAKWAINQKLK